MSTANKKGKIHCLPLKDMQSILNEKTGLSEQVKQL